MIYVTGSIRGRLDKYKKLLEKINLRERDDLYVLGDIISDSKDSFRVLEDMSMRSNVFSVLGDNEYVAHKIMTEIADGSGRLVKDKINATDTSFLRFINEFVGMDDDGRAWVMEYMSEMSLYEELETRGRKYILVHSGIGNFDVRKSLSEYSIKELALSDTDYKKCYYQDKILITAHTPTYKIDKSYSGQIYRSETHIGLNCAYDDGGFLGAICLDTGEEYYV